MQDAVEAKLVSTITSIAESVGELRGLAGEISRDVAEVKAHLAKLNGSAAKHERELAETFAWQAAHNAEHAGARDDEQAEAGLALERARLAADTARARAANKVEWVKAAVPFVTALPSVIVLVMVILGMVTPAQAVRALDLHVPAPTGVPVGAPTLTPAATTALDLQGGGGLELFATPTPIVPRSTPTPDEIIEVAPGGMQATPSRFGDTWWDIDGTYYPRRALNVRTCTSTNRCYLRQIPANVPVKVFRMVKLANGDLWLAVKDGEMEYVAFVIGDTVYGTLVCAGGVCIR